MICRDGSFAVIFNGSPKDWHNMQFLLGCSSSDNLFELLGGGFDISDLTPLDAVIREVKEETNGYVLCGGEFVYFCHMIQKLPKLGDNEKGHVFGFYKEVEKISNFIEPSHEHSLIEWHRLPEILRAGDTTYRTSTLRIIVHLMKYLSDNKFRFGILSEKINFNSYIF